MTSPQKPWRARTRVAASAVALLIGSSAALVACGNEPDDNTVAKLLPENTLGFASVAVSPSNKQKLSLFALSKHLPSKVQTEKADDVRDKLIAELFEGSSLNYDADVKPWLGSEAAAAVLPGNATDHLPVIVAAVKQTDKDKAQAALDKSKQNAKSYRFIDDYIFFVEYVEGEEIDADAVKALDDIEALAKDDKKSLQNNKRFKNNLDQLHGEHLVIGWVDTPAAAREGIAAMKVVEAESQAGAAAEQRFNDIGTSIGSANYRNGSRAITPVQAATPNVAPDPSGLPGSDLSTTMLGGTAFGLLDSLSGTGVSQDAYNELQKSADEMGSFSFELYATSDSLVFEGVTEKIPAEAGEGTEKRIFNSLPNDTLGALTVSDFGKNLQTMLTELQKDVDDQAYNAELKPVIDKLVGSLGNEAVGFVNSNGKPVAGGGVAELKDAAAAQAAIDELITKFQPTGFITAKDLSVPGGKGWDIEPQSPGSSSYAIDPNTGQFKVVPGQAKPSGTHVYIGIANNRLGIASDATQLNTALAGNGDLGNQAPVKKALTDQKVVFGSMYINISQIVALAEKEGETFTGEDEEWVKTLDVLGTQSWEKDEHYHMEARLGMK
jgi:hypothetical protein